MFIILLDRTRVTAAWVGVLQRVRNVRESDGTGQSVDVIKQNNTDCCVEFIFCRQYLSVLCDTLTSAMLL